MPVIPNNVDWSATAAWIALVISITGTIVGPIASALITNRHQLKMHRLTIQEQAFSDKQNTLNNCISSIGLFLSNPSTGNIQDFGKYFFNVYVYISKEDWPLLDHFYSLIIDKNYAAAREKREQVIHLLSESLKEAHQ